MQVKCLGQEASLSQHLPRPQTLRSVLIETKGGPTDSRKDGLP